jgi:hypothetical protein
MSCLCISLNILPLLEANPYCFLFQTEFYLYFSILRIVVELAKGTRRENGRDNRDNRDRNRRDDRRPRRNDG